MKKLFILLSLFVSYDLFAAQGKVEDAKIISISMRTLEYSEQKYADMALIKLDKSFTSNAEGCDSDEVYLLANQDKAMFSALLAAKMQGQSMKFFIDANMPKIDSWCKLVAIDF